MVKQENFDYIRNFYHSFKQGELYEHAVWILAHITHRSSERKEYIWKEIPVVMEECTYNLNLRTSIFFLTFMSSSTNKNLMIELIASSFDSIIEFVIDNFFTDKISENVQLKKTVDITYLSFLSNYLRNITTFSSNNKKIQNILTNKLLILIKNLIMYSLDFNIIKNFNEGIHIYKKNIFCNVLNVLTNLCTGDDLALQVKIDFT